MLRAVGPFVALLLLAGPVSAEPTARFDELPPPGRAAPNARSAVPPAPDPRAGAARGEGWARSAARARLARAERHEQRGDAALALAGYHEAIRLDPSFGEAYLRIAALRQRLGDPREAERTYEQAMRSPTTRAAALAGRSRARRALGRIDDAFRDLEAAVTLEPTRERLEELARWYVERRAWPAALVAWRRVLALLDGQTSKERNEVELRIRALTLLASDSDPVVAGAQHGWIRSSLAHIARNPR